MRQILDRLYLWSGYAAAICLLCIGLTILAQILGRFWGVALDSTETAGFFLAGATYLGLAHTFKSGDHIRVTLVTRFASGLPARILFLWATGFGVLTMIYFSYWSLDLVYFSIKFNDISPGLLAIPFWIPRSLMAIGAIIFTIALLDEFISIARGEAPGFEKDHLSESELL